jgi:hypothetical protein
MFIFSFFWFFPRRVDPGSARLKKRKKVPGEKLPALTPVSRQRRVWKKSRLLGKTTCRKRESPIPVSETSELFVGMQNKALSVAPMRVCNPDRSPSE